MLSWHKMCVSPHCLLQQWVFTNVNWNVSREKTNKYESWNYSLKFEIRCFFTCSCETNEMSKKSMSYKSYCWLPVSVTWSSLLQSMDSKSMWTSWGGANSIKLQKHNTKRWPSIKAILCSFKLHAIQCTLHAWYFMYL